MLVNDWKTDRKVAAVLILFVVTKLSICAGLSEPFLVFTHAQGIESLKLNDNSRENLYSNGLNVRGVDGMWNEGNPVVFWSDKDEGHIFNGSWKDGKFIDGDRLITAGRSSVDGLAVDWIGRNLFWAESKFGWIEMVSLDNTILRAVVVTGIDGPSAIALDSSEGLLFWTNIHGVPKIERSSLSGRNRTTIFNVTSDIPNGLTLDYKLKRIYWVDAKRDSVHSSDYDGRSHIELATKDHAMQSPFGISVYQDSLYWSDSKRNILYEMKIGGGSPSKKLYSTYHGLFGVALFHPERHPIVSTNPCDSDQSGCSELCVPGFNNEAVCLCSHLMDVGPVNGKCEAATDMLVISEYHKEGSDGYNVIVGLTTSSTPYHPITLPIVTPEHATAFGLQVDGSSAKVYWVDVKSVSRKIVAASLVHSTNENIFNMGDGHVTGFASDFESRRLFYSMIDGRHYGMYSCHLQNFSCSRMVDIDGAYLLGTQKDDRRLVWKELHGNVTIFKRADLDGSSVEVLFKMENFPEYNGFAVAPRGSLVYFISNSSVISKLNLESGKFETFAWLPNNGTAVSILMDAQTILVGDRLGQLFVWNASTGEYLGNPYNSSAVIGALVFTRFQIEKIATDEPDLPGGCLQPPCSQTSEPEPTNDPLINPSTTTYRPPSANLKKLFASSGEGNDTAVQLTSSPDCPLKCYNGGRCESLSPGHHLCLCAVGYRGMACQFSVCNDYCENGRCFVDRTGQPQCQCQLGFYGSRCERSMCANFCHHGRCNLSEGRPLCLCEVGWTGPKCTLREFRLILQTRVCDYYCLHGGTCQPSLSPHQPPLCVCLPEFGGLRCEISESWAPFWMYIILFVLAVSFITSLVYMIKKTGCGKLFPRKCGHVDITGDFSALVHKKKRRNYYSPSRAMSFGAGSGEIAQINFEPRSEDHIHLITIEDQQKMGTYRLENNCLMKS